MKVPPLLSLLLFSSCAVLQNEGFLSKSEKLMGTHRFVYALPYEKGTAHRVAQGYESLFSHWGDYAIDFKMKPGTKVLAARGGVVVFVRQDNDRGGVGKRFVGTGNGITVKHADGTYAHYWHLQHNGALVAVGDSVVQGQWIGRSGSTGFSAFPHLHFEVTTHPAKSDSDFPVMFQTERGAEFLRPLKKYRAQ